MFKSYCRIIWRNFIRDRQFSLLNLVGLATGLTCTVLICLWIADELKVDTYNEKDERLFQVMQNMENEFGITTIPNTAGLLARSLAQEIPEIEYGVAVLPASWFPFNGVATHGDIHIKAGGHYVSRDYFKAFTIPFIEGDKNRIFADNNTVAISEELAQKFFKTTSGLVGKSLEWDQSEFSGSFIISGVFKKNPSSATDQFDLLFNYDLVLKRRSNLLNWGNSDPHTYVLVKEGTDIDKLNAKIKNFIDTKEKNSGKTLLLARFSKRYLYGKYENGVLVGGRIAYVKLFAVIAGFILIIACINFMNLSTAKASRRLKEVGIKKVVGASRSTLIWQYLGESLLMAFISLVIAFGMVMLLLPGFNSITGKQLDLRLDLSILSFIIAITLLTGFIAGSYPAYYLSRFRPVAILKGKLRASLGELWIRKGLVVFQFTLSVGFITAVLIVYKQLNFIQSKQLGYNRDNIIHFEIPLKEDSAQLNAAANFVQTLNSIPGVINASSYYHNLLGDHGSISGFEWPGKPPGLDIDFSNLEVGYNFMETAGIRIKEGKNFSKNDHAHGQIIFNETAIRQMGLKDPVGKTIKFWGMEKQIVGVAADFNFESLYKPVQPCFFRMFPVLPNIMVKTNGDKLTIERIGKAFADFTPGMAFDYKFLDEDYQALYAAETRVGVLAKCFAALAIIISCLGLFGLSAFTAQRRQKEIGIRKVVGASASHVAAMLSKDFLKLVFVAILIALPLSWWAMNEWLNGFAYRTHVGPGVFLIAAASTVIVTLLTISFQSIRAAIANPVKSLRNE